MKKSLLTFLIFFLSISSLLAQVPPPPDYHENATPGSSPNLPVDQYIFYLMGIALALGIYFFWQKRKVVNQF